MPKKTQNTTLRNVHAAKKRETRFFERLDSLQDAIIQLESRIDSLQDQIINTCISQDD